MNNQAKIDFAIGGHSSITSIFFSHYLYFINYAKNYFPEDECEDIVMEAFLRLLNKVEKRFDNTYEIRGYLYKTIKNYALNKIRKKPIIEKYYQSVNHSSNDIVEVDYDTEQYKNELVKEIWREVSLTFSNANRGMEVFVLLYLEGYSIDETADRLNISRYTVKGQRQKFVDKLRKIYAERKPKVIEVLKG